VNELQTINDILRWGESRFNEAKLYFGHGTHNAADEVLHLALCSLHLSYDIKPHVLNCRLTPSERRAIIELILTRIEKRVPASYLTHEAWFAGLKFYVDERVLVPRSPIAELIEQGFGPWVTPEKVSNILDLCTGSGCIAISCAYAFPEAHVDGADISTEALAVADINLKQHELDEQVTFIQSDLFSALQDKKYDIIVSNPPYVDAEDFASMPDEYHHEPKIGLEAGEDGLDCVIEILKKAADFLSDNGILIVEVGNSQQALVEKYPEVEFTWLEFERGGDGVFLLTKNQLEIFTT